VLCAALLVVPLAALNSGGDASASADRTPAGHATGDAGAHHRTARPARRTATVTIDAAPVAAVTPTTAPPAPTTTTTTTTVPPTTTTTTTAPQPAVAQAVAAGEVESTGQVTYYDHPAGRCASPWLPFGTVVHITNPATGASVVCTVDDREADTARAIDLATATFAELAPLSQGVVDARLSW